MRPLDASTTKSPAPHAGRAGQWPLVLNAEEAEAIRACVLNQARMAVANGDA